MSDRTYAILGTGALGNYLLPKMLPPVVKDDGKENQGF